MTKAYLKQNIDIDGDCCGDDCKFYEWRQGWNTHYCKTYGCHLVEVPNGHPLRCQACLDEAQEEE
jgi:hypothetical protein